MVQDSIKNWRWPLGGGEIGAVLVVNLNRARADQRNLLRMLLSKDDHGIVIIGTKHELGGANWVPQPPLQKKAATEDKAILKCSCNTGCITSRSSINYSNSFERSGNLCSSSCYSTKPFCHVQKLLHRSCFWSS
ncbi:hypothetical protein T4B_9047 [Trichinella pseudospiralis]|uniref:Uncharacterized protein n=1 Tax=Trichinella pseudospiralis TaxID=6337 RepID=A0A0V1GS12_TRIPS|nr:hypothetical protein T4E_8159 [Trichinella pseudospiralis]KRX96191.1 hypothetical protein T4E_8111 [Trichinella pseudospiralis]KRZ01099.1 hypothetical protein T4B_9047 [Trichinella pseudospiralis]